MEQRGGPEETRRIIRDARLQAYENWVGDLDRQVTEGTLTAASRNTKLARAIYAKDLWAQRYKGIANRDSLTGLPNRRLFMQKLNEAAQANQTVGLLWVDLDKFKDVNDTLGHAAGDQALIETTLILETGLRQAELARQQDMVARLGGDEFGILLWGVTSEEALEHIAERLRSSVEQNRISVQVENGRRHTTDLSLSIGGGIFRGGDIDAFFTHIDKEALYRAKEEGRNRSVILRPTV